MNLAVYRKRLENPATEIYSTWREKDSQPGMSGYNGQSAGEHMRIKTILAGLTLLITVALSTAQTTVKTHPELIDAQGFQKIVQQHKGQPLLITFWATWCEPCRD